MRDLADFVTEHKEIHIMQMMTIKKVKNSRFSKIWGCIRKYKTCVNRPNTSNKD